MPANSKPKRKRPADNVPSYIRKDAATPDDNTDVVCEGEPLREYMEELENDNRLNYEL